MWQNSKEILEEFGKIYWEQNDLFINLLNNEKVSQVARIIFQINMEQLGGLNLLDFVAFGIFLEQNKDKLLNVEPKHRIEIPEAFKKAFREE